jgi:hypothetical protein
MDLKETQSLSKNRKESKSKNKSKRKLKTQIYAKNDNLNDYESCSNKYNNIFKIHHFDKSSSNKDSEFTNNLCISNKKYRKDLFNKYCIFLDKKKFKLSNNFDEKHSKKFLDKKDKCLERIIISDEIENNNKDLGLKKKKFSTQKSIHNYFIVISNYDEELKKNKSSNEIKPINKTKTYIDKK